MGLLISIEHVCPYSTFDNRPYVDIKNNGSWQLPSDDVLDPIGFCPYCGDHLYHLTPEAIKMLNEL